MPEALCRKNMAKIETVLKNMPAILDGLTRGLDLSILDSGSGAQNGRPLSYFSQTSALGAILPSNSPGVHSLWLPAIPLKVPLALKPGREEPWTPFRIAQAFIAAGCPPEAFGYYPSDHSGATEILLRCGRSMFFGDQSSVGAWKNDPRVQIHGPGWSKIIIAEDKISDWEKYLDMIVTSIVENAGRSCLNASGVWVPAHGREIAETLAKRLAQIEAKPMDHPEAKLAAFTNKKFARRLNAMIESQLQTFGAVDLTAKYRSSARLVEHDGCTFLLPTIVWCEDPQHALANTEFLFPFASVVQVPQKEILHTIGSSLVVTAITQDEMFVKELFASPNVDRLNLGVIPTNKISWDQPHEGNLFEHLFRQRAFQKMD
jgi:acyl-CoA reductase-like NAD-dependent aldehyde dehydrogenase